MHRLTLDESNIKNPELPDKCPCVWGEVVEEGKRFKKVYCIFAETCKNNNSNDE